MRPPLHNCPKGTAGFTLLEVLVATAVLALMMAILLSSVSTTLNLWRTTENKISADREGRSAHLLLAQDLANAVVPTNTTGTLTNFWPRITDNGTRLGFLTTRSPEYQGQQGDVGDVCYVEYVVQSNGLFRRFAGSQETFAAMLNGVMPIVATNPLTSRPQVLADNIIPNTNALLATPVQKTASDWQAIRTNFVAVRFAPSGSGIRYDPAGSSRPDAIEVQISATDMEALRNISNLPPNVQIRSAGFYTFRVNLPR
jgi:prepilin-type N-terminal cleavage/methylation domain-containing protein